MQTIILSEFSTTPEQKRNREFRAAMRITQYLGIAPLILLAVGSLIACDSPVVGPSETGEEKISMKGQVTEVFQADQQGRAQGLQGAISVDGVLQGDERSVQVSVAVTDKTLLFVQVGQSRRPVAFEAIEKGQPVQINFLGPLAETFPLQATADEIVLLE